MLSRNNASRRTVNVTLWCIGRGSRSEPAILIGGLLILNVVCRRTAAAGVRGISDARMSSWTEIHWPTRTTWRDATASVSPAAAETWLPLSLTRSNRLSCTWDPIEKHGRRSTSSDVTCSRQQSSQWVVARDFVSSSSSAWLGRKQCKRWLVMLWRQNDRPGRHTVLPCCRFGVVKE